jgi:hypothetical protein
MRPNAEDRYQVMLLTACGMARKDVATVLKVDVGTLAIRFERELKEGPAVIRKELRAAVTAAAISGKTTTMALLLKMDRDDAQRAHEHVRQEQKQK